MCRRRRASSCFATPTAFTLQVSASPATQKRLTSTRRLREKFATAPPSHSLLTPSNSGWKARSEIFAQPFRVGVYPRFCVVVRAKTRRVVGCLRHRRCEATSRMTRAPHQSTKSISFSPRFREAKEFARQKKRDKNSRLQEFELFGNILSKLKRILVCV